MSQEGVFFLKKNNHSYTIKQNMSASGHFLFVLEQKNPINGELFVFKLKLILKQELKFKLMKKKFKNENFTQWVKVLLLSLVLFASCEKKKEPEPEVKRFSIAPSTFMGRTNDYLGCISLQNRKVRISVWDNGQIDGDIVSVYVNGKQVIRQITLDGPSNKYSIDVTLDYEGYNYILLYAHNEGSIPPNTASISVDDGAPRVFQLSSNLSTNGYVDLIVGGSKYNLSCNNSGSGNNPPPTSGNNPPASGGGNNNTGTATFWVNSDLGCGSITVNCNNQSGTITSYYSSAPNCGASGCANFTLPPGTYNFTASCTNKTWNGSITVTSGGCSRMRLY